MNGHGDDGAGTAEAARQLQARNAAVFERTAATLARVRTNHAVLHPLLAGRDTELVRIHIDALQFFQSHLPGSWVPGYLAGRGMEAVFLDTSPWQIGYAPGHWTALTNHLRGLGYGDQVLLRSGLSATGKDGHLRDHFHDRLMIPLRAEDGVVVGFIGRRPPQAGDEHGPKYLNSPDTELFTKKQVLAGLAEGRAQLTRGAQPVLVEGPLDAIAVSIAAPGQYIGVAPCGTSFTSEQAAALGRNVDLPDRGIRVALDGDAAGRKAAVRAYSALSPLTAAITAVTFPDGRDPAETLEKDGRQALNATLSTSVRPLADLVTDSAIDDWARGRELKFIEYQIGAVRAAARMIATMPASEVGHQAARLCDVFGRHYDWHPWEITREVIDAIEKRYPPDNPPRRGLPPATAAIVARGSAPLPRQPELAGPIPGPQPPRPQRATSHSRERS
jgi:DNA primase